MAETSTPSRAPSRIPRINLAIAGLVLLVGLAVAFLGAVTVGTTWDERVQLYMLQAYFDKGWHTAADIIDGYPDPAFYFGTYVYGPIGELLPHFINVVLGREEFWGALSDSAEAYAGRHIGIAIWGALGVLAAAATVTVITRSWRWGLIGAAVLASIPLWTGHAMFNIKDTPTATGYIIFSLGLVALFDRRYFSDRRIRVLALGGIALGLFVVIGTRTALALPLVLTLPVMFLIGWVILRRGGADRREARLGRRFLEAVGGYVAAYLALVLVYPKAFLNPIEVGIESILDSALYPVNEAQLVNGEWLVQPVSWLYQPLWFSAQLPLLVLAGLLGFIIWWLVRALRVLALGSSISEVSAAWLTQPVPLLLQISIVPIAAVVGQSTLYNGTRQMLFVPPAAAVLATLAVSRLVGWRRVSVSRSLRSVTWVAVAVGMIVPITAQIQLFPYGYTFVNALTATRPVDGNWPTDYWRASGRELLRVLPDEGADSCGLEQLQKGELFPCTEQPMFLPYLDERGTDAKPVTLAPTEYWFIRENSGVLDLPPGCRPFTEVTRPLFWQSVTIGQIAICDTRVDTGKRNMADPSQPVPES